MIGKTFVRRRGITPIPNNTVYDRRLTYAALGLLTVLLARPDGAPAGYRDLTGRGLGEKATLAALRELDEAGYRHLVRRSGARGRLVTDVVVSEVPITREEADEYLAGGTLAPFDRAATGAARSDLGKQGVSAGGTVQCSTVARSTVARSGTARVLRTPKVTTSLRSESPGTPSARDPECPHGEARGASHCALCRRGIPDGAHQLALVIDNRSRAAGAHLEAVQ